MSEPLRLTELSPAASGRGLRRYGTFGAWRRVAFLAFIAVREVLTALPHDLRRAWRAPTATWIRMEPGVRPAADATRIALYVHYSATGCISEMVRRQLATLSQLGFGIAFVSMADCIPEADWQAVRQLAALVAQRPNFGLDFGAWRDLMPEVRRRWSVPQELLLANDSVLGPIHPLGPAIEAMRAGGDGMFGLTESLQGGPHLQSYMVLARGLPAVQDLMHFVQGLRISSSKWLLVHMAEIRMSQWMRWRGHRVAALFGYRRLAEVLAVDREERMRLQMVYKRFANLAQLSDEAAVGVLHRWPLNPTHHLWRVLATQFDCPFLKTELIRRNPARVAGVTEWRTLVPLDSPCPLQVIEAHLATLEPADTGPGRAEPNAAPDRTAGSRE